MKSHEHAMRRAQTLTFPDRAQRNGVALLAVGLGGTGGDALLTLKESFASHFRLPRDEQGHTAAVPPRTAFLLIDADPAAQRPLPPGELVDIALPPEAVFPDDGEGPRLSAAERLWFDRRLTRDTLPQSRQYGRLMLWRRYDAVQAAIARALESITQQSPAETALPPVEIVLLTGVTGVVGSGAFLDLAQIIRHTVASSAALCARLYHITAYLVMPDISLDQLRALPSGSPALRLMKARAFAALKELDFWQRVPEHRTPYAVQTGDTVLIPWDAPPFDACHLLCRESTNGTIRAGAYSGIGQTIANRLLQLCAANPAQNGQYPHLALEAELRTKLQALAAKRPAALPLYAGYRSFGESTLSFSREGLLFFEAGCLLRSLLSSEKKEKALEALAQNYPLYAQPVSDTTDQYLRTVMDAAICTVSITCPLPDFSDAIPVKRPAADVPGRPQPAPHDLADQEPLLWRSQTLRLVINPEANRYLKTAWRQFSDFAAAALLDLSLGPFCLLSNLRKDRGLLPSLREIINLLEKITLREAAGETRAYERCAASWQAYRDRALLNEKTRTLQYRDALNDYFHAVIGHEVYKAFTGAFTQLAQRVETFGKTLLSPLCAELELLADTLPADDEHKKSRDEHRLEIPGFIRRTITETAPGRLRLLTQSNEAGDGFRREIKERLHRRLQAAAEQDGGVSALLEILNDLFFDRETGGNGWIKEKSATDELAPLLSDVIHSQTLSGPHPFGTNPTGINRLFADLCDGLFDAQATLEAHQASPGFYRRIHALCLAADVLFEDSNAPLKTMDGIMPFGIESPHDDGRVNSLLEEFLPYTPPSALSDPSARLRDSVFMRTVTEGIVRSAHPFFRMDADDTHAPCAQAGCLFVPDDSPLLLRGLQDTISEFHMAAVSSGLHDQLYCLSLLGGLPLYRYGMLRALETAYEETLQSANGCPGLHLVCTAETDAPYTADWTLLPSPRPYCFFSAHGSVREEARFAAARALTARARACGMLTVDDAKNPPRITVNLLYGGAQGGEPLSAAEIRQQADALARPGSTPEQTREAVIHYRDSAARETLPVACGPECMIPFLGLDSGPCSPWDAALAQDAAALEAARNNYLLLCGALAAAVLYLHPRLLHALKTQVEGWEYLAGIAAEQTENEQP